MTVYVESKGVKVAFGLVWKHIEEKGEKKQLAALVRRHKATHHIRWGSGSNLRYGVAAQRKGAPVQGKKTPVLSAAALFACQAGGDRNALLLLPIDEKHTRYGLIALVDGVPYLDLVIGATHVRERVESLRQEGHGAYAEYGSHPDFPGATEWTIEQLIGEFAAQATMTKSVVKSPSGKRAAIGFALLAVAAFNVWDYLETQRLEEEAAQEKQVDPVAEYKQSVRLALSAASLPGADAYQAFWTPLNGRTTAVEGWAIDKIECNRTGCTEDWVRLGGTNDMLIRQLPEGTRFELAPPSVGLDKARATRPFAAKGSAMGFATLPRKEPFEIELTSQAQRRTFEKDLIGEAGVSYKPEQVKVHGNTDGVPANLHLLSGKVTISGPVGLMKETLLTLPENLAIDEMSMTSVQDALTTKFMIKGTFYVKN
ncbi:type 4b pilus protein PilO2 [Agrobacterium tumefaciens]|uniref:type 4b pilus protein PilO2 n=1 Tax=Agrobacterium tumefaciens TaxID=358 RepID=UPI0015735BAC|nr:type 4b pilus protein PilO2 [Agrobacterium tumefaciens]NTB05937.1 type 4b pilus protein PilO2 [Agrobacterium tumefaciens]